MLFNFFCVKLYTLTSNRSLSLESQIKEFSESGFPTPVSALPDLMFFSPSRGEHQFHTTISCVQDLLLFSPSFLLCRIQANKNSRQTLVNIPAKSVFYKCLRHFAFNFEFYLIFLYSTKESKIQSRHSLFVIVTYSKKIQWQTKMESNSML